MYLSITATTITVTVAYHSDADQLLMYRSHWRSQEVDSTWLHAQFRWPAVATRIDFVVWAISTNGRMDESTRVNFMELKKRDAIEDAL